MTSLLSFCLGLLFFLLISPRTVNAELTVLDDPLSPEALSMSHETKDSKQIEKMASNEEMNIDDLLGPKDNFPFLPDNHRDSGTGKFNSF